MLLNYVVLLLCSPVVLMQSSVTQTPNSVSKSTAPSAGDNTSISNITTIISGNSTTSLSSTTTLSPISLTTASGSSSTQFSINSTVVTPTYNSNSASTIVTGPNQSSTVSSTASITQTNSSTAIISDTTGTITTVSKPTTVTPYPITNSTGTITTVSNVTIVTQYSITNSTSVLNVTSAASQVTKSSTQSSASTLVSSTTATSTLLPTSATTAVTTAQSFIENYVIKLDDIWTDDLSNQQSTAFIQKAKKIETDVTAALAGFPLVSVKVIDLKQGSIVANTAVTFSAPVSKKQTSNAIVAGIPGSSVIDPKAAALPDWAVIIIAVACTLFVIALAFVITAMICRRRRLQGYNRYGAGNSSQSIEMNDNWKYPKRTTDYRVDETV